MSEVSNISRKVIIESRRGKVDKGKRAQSSTSKRAGFKPSETISNISQKVIIDTRKGKEDKVKGKYEKYGKEQKYFSKNIVIVPEQTTYRPEKKEKEQKFFSKNIIITPAKSSPNVYEVSKPGKGQKYFNIEPSRKTFEKTEKGKRTTSSSFRNINIETRKGRDYNVAQEAHLRTSSTDNKKAGKVMELIKGVQYFTKNIVITPVPIEYKTSKKKSYKVENLTSNKSGKEKDWKETNAKFGNNVIISSGKQTKSGSSEERKTWGIDAKYGINGFSGDSILSDLNAYDDNTKFFHKEITILPVYIPPPKYYQK